VRANEPDDLPKRHSVWHKTPSANPLRSEPSRVYSAKVRINGKLFCEVLKQIPSGLRSCGWPASDKSSAGKHKAPAQSRKGTCPLGDALGTFQAGVEADPALQPRATADCRWRWAALLKCASPAPPAGGRGGPCGSARSSGSREHASPGTRAPGMPIHPVKGSQGSSAASD